MTGFVTADGAMRHTQGGGRNTGSETQGKLYLEAFSQRDGLVIETQVKSLSFASEGSGGGKRVTGVGRSFIIRNLISENKSSLLRKQTLKKESPHHTWTIKSHCFTHHLSRTANNTIKSEGQT